MQRERRDPLYVEDMITAGERIISLVGDRSKEEIANDQNLVDALLWNFTILGEAATQISAETKSLYRHVDWRRPSALRNLIVHAYWKIDVAVLRKTAREQLADYVKELRTVLAVMDDHESAG